MPKTKAVEPWHGTINGYQWHGCRCKACTHAMTSYQADYRKRKFAGKGCSVKGCPRVASQAAGNGLCYKHHATKMRRKSTAAGRKRKAAK